MPNSTGYNKNGTYAITGNGTAQTLYLKQGATNVTFVLSGRATTYTITSLAGSTVTVNSNVTGNTIDLTGASAAYNVSSASGVVVTVNNSANAGTVFNLSTNSGTVDLASSVHGIGSTSVITIDGGQFTFASSLLADLGGATLKFSAPGGTVEIGSASAAAVDLTSALAPITGFTTSSDIIDDQALVFADITSYAISGTAANQLVTVTASNGTTFKFDVSGSNFIDKTYTVASGPLHITSDGHSGTDIAACFLGGTMIAVPGGEVAVEALKIGDLVLAADGRAVPVRWLGINTVSTRFADPLRFMPIRVKAGALSDGVPKRDLLLSPEHALFIDGTLIQAGALVNGVSITRETWMPETFIYYHVEVEAHSLIMVEDTPAETFVDHITRMVFDNWAEHQELYGDDDHIAEMTYPRAQSARQVPYHIRDLLLSRQPAFSTARDAA